METRVRKVGESEKEINMALGLFREATDLDVSKHITHHF